MSASPQQPGPQAGPGPDGTVDLGGCSDCAGCQLTCQRRPQPRFESVLAASGTAIVLLAAPVALAWLPAGLPALLLGAALLVLGALARVRERTRALGLARRLLPVATAALVAGYGLALWHWWAG